MKVVNEGRGVSLKGVLAADLKPEAPKENQSPKAENGGASPIGEAFSNIREVTGNSILQSRFKQISDLVASLQTVAGIEGNPPGCPFSKEFDKLALPPIFEKGFDKEAPCPPDPTCPDGK